MVHRARVLILKTCENDRRELHYPLSHYGMDVEIIQTSSLGLKLANSHRRDCLVVPISSKEQNDFHILRELKKERYRIPILIIVKSGDVESAVQAMKLGATNVMQEPYDTETLINTVRHTLDGSGCDPVDAELVYEVRDRIGQLTGRERQVMELVITGLSSKAIARKIDIRHRTVEAHRAHLLEKMGVSSTAELIYNVMAARHYSGLPLELPSMVSAKSLR